MSVLSYLERLGSELVLSGTEKSNIATSLYTLQTRLRVHFNNLDDMLVFGSFDRDVILPRKVDDYSDVDFMIVFNNSHSYTTQTCLNWLKNFIENKYSTSERYQSAPTIVLNLNHIKFELVPAYRSYHNLFIPAPSNSYQTWMETNPQIMKTNLINKNNQNNYKIKPLIRVMKYWNVLNSKVFSSYELENMILNKYYFYCTNLKDYFYSFVESLNTIGLSQVKIRNINRLKETISEIKDNEVQYPNWAEAELTKLLPRI